MNIQIHFFAGRNVLRSDLHCHQGRVNGNIKVFAKGCSVQLLLLVLYSMDSGHFILEFIV